MKKIDRQADTRTHRQQQTDKDIREKIGKKKRKKLREQQVDHSPYHSSIIKYTKKSDFLNVTSVFGQVRYEETTGKPADDKE